MSNFIYDNIPSHIFGLTIGNIGHPGVTDTGTYANVEIISDRAAKRTEPYHYGIKLQDGLEFPMEIYNRHGRYYEMYEVQAIQEWLFGRREAKYLSILDADKDGESYLCWLTEPNVVKLESKVIGWRFKAVCTACYSVTDIVEQRYECADEYTTIDYYNLSNIDDYVYPEMEIQLLGNTTYIRIENHDDNDRAFQILNMKPGSVIYVNNDLQYMRVVTGGGVDSVFEHFNLNWLRFAAGRNRLNVSGMCEITFRTRFKKAVGGY